MSEPSRRRAARAITMTISILVSVAAATGPPVGLATADGRSMPGNPDAITGDQMRAYLEFIASDELEGRKTPSRGLDVAARYIASHLARCGATPAGGDGSYLQRIPLRRHAVIEDATYLVFGGRRWNFGDDLIARPDPGTVTGRLVFAGHGWVVSDRGIDAYDGVDVRDKIVVVVGDDLPDGLRYRDLRGERRVDWFSPRDYAWANGARGVIVLPSLSTLADWDRRADEVREGGILSPDAVVSDAGVPTVTVSAELAAALLEGEGLDLDDLFVERDDLDAFELGPGKSVEIAVAVDETDVRTQNVVAVLEGEDPALRDEYVAFGAHYDHVGIGRPIGGDAIYNGADDDGSGTVALMALAEAFARGPRPARSLLFVWHAGEEIGMWGSEYFTEHPTVPLEAIVTAINIDMIGRSRPEGDRMPERRRLTGPNEVYVIGPKIMSRDLEEIVEEVNRRTYDLDLDDTYDRRDHPERFFFRSDHYSYARRGIPVVFFFTGVHEDYHRPSDRADKIDYGKLERITRTVYELAWELGSRPDRPHVDDDFEL